MNGPVRKVVILGGGTAGWMSAALLKKLVGESISIELVESELIGTVGVGEATIPPIQLVNQVLGFDEAEFIRETKATIKLAIRFENWKQVGESYYHTFGAAGKSAPFCHFHHFWNKARLNGDTTSLWEYDLNYLSAEAGKFAKINHKDPFYELSYAYHFDAGLYAKYLRKLSEKMGVVRTEGLVEKAELCNETGFVKSLQLKDSRIIEGDLFIDCSGFRGFLTQEHLATGYEDWSHLLQCDRAIAVPSERHEKTSPFTRSIAHSAGWQWRIPLQHRNGNGLVYSSNHYSEDEATELLLGNLDTKPLADPKVIRFKTGRRRKQWNRNVVAVGLSSGFLEPLESTSIHLIQNAVIKLAHLFPHQGFNQSIIDEYNKQSQIEFEQIRDFLVLHYHVTERTDSAFWRDMRALDIPDTLRHKIELFREDGRLFREQNDLFLESSWLQVMLGQGIYPQDYHPIVNNLSDQKLKEMLANVKELKRDPLNSLLDHDEFLQRFCGLK